MFHWPYHRVLKLNRRAFEQNVRDHWRSQTFVYMQEHTLFLEGLLDKSSHKVWHCHDKCRAGQDTANVSINYWLQLNDPGSMRLPEGSATARSESFNDRELENTEQRQSSLSLDWESWGWMESPKVSSMISTTCALISSQLLAMWLPILVSVSSFATTPRSALTDMSLWRARGCRRATVGSGLTNSLSFSWGRILCTFFSGKLLICLCSHHFIF